jgi:hypothetical protein
LSTQSYKKWEHFIRVILRREEKEDNKLELQTADEKKLIEYVAQCDKKGVN